MSAVVKLKANGSSNPRDFMGLTADPIGSWLNKKPLAINNHIEGGESPTRGEKNIKVIRSEVLVAY